MTVDDPGDDEMSTAEMLRSPLATNPRPTLGGSARTSRAAPLPAAPAGRRLGPLLLVGAISALTILVLVLLAIGLGKQLGLGKDSGAASPPAGTEGPANAESRPAPGKAR
jgi:hypothetical protein